MRFRRDLEKATVVDSFLSQVQQGADEETIIRINKFIGTIPDITGNDTLTMDFTEDCKTVWMRLNGAILAQVTSPHLWSYTNRAYFSSNTDFPDIRRDIFKGVPPVIDAGVSVVEVGGDASNIDMTALRSAQPRRPTALQRYNS